MKPSTIFSGFRKKLPLMLQTEAAECGLACLAMIANYFGHAIDLPAMRRRFSTSSRGATLPRIVAIAHGLGFDTRPLRVELEYLPQLQTPCILHWNMNHFVVLKRATAKSIEIHDPRIGYRSLPMGEVGKHFTGIALEMQPSIDFRPVKEQESISLGTLAGNLHGVKGAIAQILVLAFGLELFALILPLYMQTVLDQVLVSTDTRLLNLLGIGFLFVIAFRAGLSAARGWAVSWIGGRLSSQWTAQLFSHLLRLPMAYFERRHIGDVTSRFYSVQAIQQTLTGSFVESILNGAMGSVTLVILALYSISLTSLVLLGLISYAVCRWLAYRQLWRATEEQIIYSARQQTSLLEAIRGVQTLKLANKQSDRAARFSSATLQTTQRNVKVQRIGIAFSSINQWLFGSLRVVIVWIAAVQVLQGQFSIGMLVAFVAYADELTTRFGGLIDRIVEFRMLRLHAGRIADVALTAPEDIGNGKYNVNEIKPEIEVDDVSFRYSENEPWILRNCSLRIHAGESVAITGPSGCGKTTLVKLILGLLKPTEGTIRVGGIPIDQFGIGAYRELIGSVMQHDELFDGSIADNISFFDDAATLDRIEAASGQAAIHDEIKAMPMGYETLVGDMGSSLSGGQKQRVLLARAFYRNPQILVLDEATSHLDPERELLINEWTSRMVATRIVIAHRQETIASADRVISISSGGTARNKSTAQLQSINQA